MLTTNKVRIFSVIWSSWLPTLREAADALSIELSAYTAQDVARYGVLREVWEEELSRATIVLLYRTSDPVWEEIDALLEKYQGRVPIISVNSTGQSIETDSTVYGLVFRYLLFGGRENMTNLLKYLIHHFVDPSVDYLPPADLPWEGIFHPRFSEVFTHTRDFWDQYLSTLGFKPLSTLGLLYSRSDWVNGNLAVVTALIQALERENLAVIPVFFYPLKDKNLRNLSGAEVITRYFLDEYPARVDGIVRLTSFPLSAARGDTERVTNEGVDLLRRLNIPLFCPVIAYSQTGEEWWVSHEGLGRQVAWSLAMPEFEGAIEPFVAGAMDLEGENYVPIEERVSRFARRVSRWMQLREKPNAEKKVVFVLHNNPCASAEATVGAAAHLDTMESIVNIMKEMARAGYKIIPPTHGQALRDEIIEKKAISEFRWTAAEDIVRSGGALAMIEKDKYEGWWKELPPELTESMRATWGEPPGEAMVYQGKILITGVKFGNAIVCVQPKRGCAGSRCDGEVCKILHDPLCPPPHHYLATYRWLERDFGADVIVHVGTHGNLEFLPGKGTGLSAKCYPDVAIDQLPHLYIYNADNPPEGTIAKRRSYACLIDHMQTVMVEGSLYGDGERLYQLISEYEEVKNLAPARVEALKPLISSLASKLDLLSVAPAELTEEMVSTLKSELESMRGTSLPDGMHVFGTIPSGERLVDFIWSILRHDGKGLFRDYLGESKKGDELENGAREVLRKYLLEGEPWEGPEKLKERIDGLYHRIKSSDEIGSLINGMVGGYVSPGPSGLITRGDEGVLPTGRNFYSFDPRLIPSIAAWETGKVLAISTIEKYKSETGRWPENMAFHWQCTDIMWSRGEGMCQMLYLLGVEPRWDREGRVKGLKVIPLDELGRPRIDITVRVSGITRDNFPSAIELLDEAVRQVAFLEEPPELNFVRKHTLEKLETTTKPREESLRRSTFRIFASMPGTYQAGTQLAIYASAWKTEEDLAGVFLYWNGYAYGKGVNGEAAHEELASNLRTVDATFNRAITDEYDLTGCCSYFGTHGGLINAARVISGRSDLKHYYGDTRDPEQMRIRTLQEEIRRVARGKILHPRWIEGMKKHGYQGAGEIMKRVGRLYGWQATTREVDSAIFDDVVRVFIMDRENRTYFAQHNPWAIEEMARRLLEAAERKLWEPSAEVKEALQEFYLEIEGYVEEKIEGTDAPRQGGNVDITTSKEIAQWMSSLKEVRK